MKLAVPTHPCRTCPYRLDTPPGIWAKEEYRKLARYDSDAPPVLAVFHCHQENTTHIPTVCRGWLSVHADCLAVRLAIAQAQVTAEERATPSTVPLYPNGMAAMRAGLKGVKRPSMAARKRIAQLLAKRRRH